MSAESLPNLIGLAIFLAAWATGMVSFLLGLAELVAIWRLDEWAYRRGPCVFRDRRPFPRPVAAIQQTLKTSNGKFRLVTPDLCLFRAKVPMAVHVTTPFPVKGSVRWHGDLAEVEGRVPLFTTIFFLAWLVGAAGFGLTVVVSQKGLVRGLLVVLIGWGFVFGMIAASIPLEVRRARRVLNELESYLTLG